MKKRLIGIVVLAFVALVCGTAFAAQTLQSIDVEATLEWTIFDETGTEWQLLMAATTISIIPTLIIFAIAQKAFVRGVVLTGIK